MLRQANFAAVRAVDSRLSRSRQAGWADRQVAAEPPLPQHRPWPMLTLRRLALPVVVASLAGCTGMAGGPPASGSGTAVTSADAAAARVESLYPLFTGLGRANPDAIGQCCWYEASNAATGYQVVIQVGWGDCPAGCISKHEWTYRVTPDGTVSTLQDTGEPVPSGILPVGAGIAGGAHASLPLGASGVAGRVTAGPTCPVVRVGDTSCDPRTVPGASIVVRNTAGAVAAHATAAADGSYAIGLAPGTYTVEGDSVARFPAPPAPSTITVVAGVVTQLDIAFDTGIR